MIRRTRVLPARRGVPQSFYRKPRLEALAWAVSLELLDRVRAFVGRDDAEVMRTLGNADEAVRDVMAGVTRNGYVGPSAPYSFMVAALTKHFIAKFAPGTSSADWAPSFDPRAMALDALHRMAAQ